MIGGAKTQMSKPVVVAIYSVNLIPGNIFVISENGSGTSPFVNSSVINGAGPFTYLWTITGSDITINSETNNKTTFSASGFNVQYNEVATLVVTDTGNANEETEKNINISFEFEGLGI